MCSRPSPQEASQLVQMSCTATSVAYAKNSKREKGKKKKKNFWRETFFGYFVAGFFSRSFNELLLVYITVTMKVCKPCCREVHHDEKDSFYSSH